MKPIVHTQETYGMRPGAEEFPLMVVLSFSYVCNARCPNCPHTICSDTRTHFSSTPFMAEELFKKIADETGAHSSMIRITGGGEPLLHPQAIELFEYAKSVGCKLGIISNGSCYTEEKLKRLLLANVDTLEFSVDAGTREEYATTRAGLNWDTLNTNVQTARRLRDLYGKETKLICSIINQKGIDLERARQYWEQFVDIVQVRKFLTYRVGESSNSADPTPYLPMEEHIPCPMLFERTTINVKGKMDFCGTDLYSAHAVGSVYDHTISELWNSDIYKDARNKHLNQQVDLIPQCKGCPDMQYRSWNYNFWNMIKK